MEEMTTKARKTPGIFKPTVAIIGGGLSGSLVAIQLLRQARKPIRILLIERDDLPGRGVAYRDQPECHRLNVRAEAMSAYADQPDHFLNWLNEQYSPCHPVGTSEFLPRRIYGAYIESLLDAASRDARPGVTLEVRTDEVVGLVEAPHGMTLHLLDQRRLRADLVVLACGNPGPADPKLPNAGALMGRSYVGQAWSTPGLYAVRPEEDLLLIGSGLTALDWLVSLATRGHRGQIELISRRGLLPHPHRPAPLHKLSFDPQALPPNLRLHLRALRKEAASVSATNGDWRSVIDALRPHTQALWLHFSEREQRRFLRHLRPYWEVHRHRAAPSVMATVDTLMRQGQMRLQAGRLIDLHEADQRLNVRVRLRGKNEVSEFCVDRVINCTGPECDYRRLDHPLIVSLREQGLISADSLGLGLTTNSFGALCTQDGTASTRLFTLGPPRKGQLWETTAVPEIRVQAQALARYLLEQSVVQVTPRPTQQAVWA